MIIAENLFKKERNLDLLPLLRKKIEIKIMKKVEKIIEAVLVLATVVLEAIVVIAVVAVVVVALLLTDYLFNN